MANLPIEEFLRTRLKEYDTKFEVRKGTSFDTLVFKPLAFIMQPFKDEIDALYIGQSLRRILQTEDPNAFDESIVDDLISNVFVTRNTGSSSSGVARVYYDFPVAREYPAGGFKVTGSNGKNYVNVSSFAITAGEMSAQLEQGTYYFDIVVVSEELGVDSNLDAGGLVSVIDDSEVITVTNKNKITGGVNREVNTDFINRAKRSISVRDMVTGKGFEAILFETFPGYITEVKAIGFGDPEMMRDILFNAHVGGKHDGYIKTNTITVKEKNFVSLLIDPTRASHTTTQVEMVETQNIYLGESSIDRTKGSPIVREVKDYESAVYLSTVDMTSTINLSGAENVSISIDGVTKVVKVSGSIPSQTTKGEILNAINNAFGVTVAFAVTYVYLSSTINTIKIQSPTEGKSSSILFADPPTPLSSGLTEVFGAMVPLTLISGDGPLTFLETIHYTVSDAAGTIKRLVPGTDIVTTAASLGSVFTANKDIINCSPSSTFAAVEDYDIVTIIGTTSFDGDYRILKAISASQIQIDTELDISSTLVLDGKFKIQRTGIKNGELVHVDYYYNPLSIDIGKYVKLDESGFSRGIRPGREEFTITDVPFLRILLIEIIDPISLEPTGEVLNGLGGFGLGGFGEGSFGIGASSDYRIETNSPAERYSCFEDSYIVVNSAYQGYSLKVTYECVPELEDVHNFCRSDKERVLDGDVLIKHFIPAYVSGTIEYIADTTDSSIPDNEALTVMVKDFISARVVGFPLDTSDIVQFILSKIDPYFRYTSKVKPFTLLAEIYNTDGTTTMVESNSVLEIPTLDPFPKYTEAPISSNICHWLAGDITMIRG